MGFKLKFYKASDLDRNLKCTIHITGKLGFSLEAIKKLNINESAYIKIAANEDDTSDKNLYMVVSNEPDNDDFKINKAGAYYYANTKALFDTLKLDYKNYTIMFDITNFEHEGQKLYKLQKREVKKKVKN